MKKKKHEVFPHFSVEVLKQRYLDCECPRERTHWHIIWLLADTTHPRTPREVAEIVRCTPDWVRKLLKRYNVEGEAAMRDKRKNNGRQRFLDETQQAALETALSEPPADWRSLDRSAGGCVDIQDTPASCQRCVRLEISEASRLHFTNTSSSTSGRSEASG